jgi:hypothetical protein
MASGASTSGQSDSSEQASISGKPEQVNTSGKSKWAVDAGWATIMAALITVLGGFSLTYFLGQSTAAKNASTGSRANDGVTIATISPPMTGDISFENTLYGHISNLQRGESLWTFFQVVKRDGSINSQTFPITGPCTVSFTSNIWTCHNAYIGTIKDEETYRVCVAVLNFSEAHMVTELIENTYATKIQGYSYWFNSPPSYIHDNSSACMSVTRIN